MTSAATALAELQLQRGKYNESIRLAQQSHNESSGQAQLVEAQALLARGQTKRAEQLVEDVLKDEPASIPALTLLVRIASSTGRSAAMANRLVRLQADHGRESGLYYLAAVANFDLKEFGKAEQNLQRALELNPREPDVYALRGRIRYSRGATSEAKEDLRRAIQESPKRASNYLLLESWYKREGDWREARTLMENARRADPESPQVAMELAYLHLEQGGDPKVALSLARFAHEKLPDSAAAADLAGWANYKVGSYREAVSLAEKSVRQAPNEPVFQYHLGMSYLALGRSGDGARVLRAAINSNPNFAFASNAKAALAQLP
jgi:predicted Zn-dependent protease